MNTAIFKKKEKKTTFTVRVPVDLLKEIQDLKKKYAFTFEDFAKESFKTTIEVLKKSEQKK
jgi:hypothetical protein